MLDFKPYSVKYRGECIDLFKSNVPKFFNALEVDEYSNYLDAYVSDNYWCGFDRNELICAGGIYVREGGIGRLVWGIVKQEHQKKGYGKQLLVFRLKKLVLTSDVSVIQLETSQLNPGFFSRFGFFETAVKENFYGPGLHSHEMELKLDLDSRKRILAHG